MYKYVESEIATERDTEVSASVHEKFPKTTVNIYIYIYVRTFLGGCRPRDPPRTSEFGFSGPIVRFDINHTFKRRSPTRTYTESRSTLRAKNGMTPRPPKKHEKQGANQSISSNHQ